MSKHLRIGVDVDGVLAKFNQPYADLIQSLFPHMEFPIIDDVVYPNTWNWEKAAGLTRKESSAVWKAISASGTFWYKLEPYTDADSFMETLEEQAKWSDAQVYFVTSRPGPTAKEQTEDWLMDHFDVSLPTVLISAEKGLCAKALDLTHYIDDKNENCLAVQTESPDTQGFMLARPWNQAQFGIPRLANVDEFASVLREAVNG